MIFLEMGPEKALEEFGQINYSEDMLYTSSTPGCYIGLEEYNEDQLEDDWPWTGLSDGALGLIASTLKRKKLNFC